MKNVNINYPHPVLSNLNDDYLDCYFTIDISDQILIEGNEICINVSYNLESPGLLEMIKKREAKVTIYIESVEAEFRKMFSFEKEINEMTVVLKKSELSNSLIVKGYIVSLIDINQFALPEHNKEIFIVGPSKIKKGDILAVSDKNYKIPLEYYDPLIDRKSIFSIRLNVEQQEDIKIDLNSNKITIMLNKELFEKYQNLYVASETRVILSTMFAVPVLVDTLSFIKNANQDELDDVLDKKWYQVIMSRLNELRINLDNESSMTEVANRVLSNVFNDSMISFKNVFNELIGDGN